MGTVWPEDERCGRCAWLAWRRSIGRVRPCARCGTTTRIAARGLCARCLASRAERAIEYGAGLAERLEIVPAWFDGFVVFCHERFAPSSAVDILRAVGKLLEAAGPCSPTQLVAASPSEIRRHLADYFALHSLAALPDVENDRAAARRDNRITATPEPFAEAVGLFAQALVARQERARRAGGRPETDHTIEARLAVLRDFARFLSATRPHVEGWASVGVVDVEAFFAGRARPSGHELIWLRHFFRWCRRKRLVVADPTQGMWLTSNHGFSAQLLTLDEQRGLFARWSSLGTDVPPHEAFVGLMALLHGAACSELRLLRLRDIDAEHHTLQLGRRARPVALDPVSSQALSRCLAHHQRQPTSNPYLLISRTSRTGDRPVSVSYLRSLMATAGTNLRQLRATRLAALVDEVDPVLVAASFGVTIGATTYYLNHVPRLPAR
jgi:site-specific recombinase XerD